MRPSERWGVRRLGGTGVVPCAQQLHSLVRRCRSRQRFKPSTSSALPVATSASADVRPSGDEAAIARRFPSAPSMQAAEAEADRVGCAASVKCLDSTQSGSSRVACPEPPDATLLGHSGQTAERQVLADTGLTASGDLYAGADIHVCGVKCQISTKRGPSAGPVYRWRVC